MTDTVSYIWSDSRTTLTGNTQAVFTLPTAGLETSRIVYLYGAIAEPAVSTTWTLEYDTDPSFATAVRFTYGDGQSTGTPTIGQRLEGAHRIADRAAGYVRVTMDNPVNACLVLVLLGYVDWPVPAAHPSINAINDSDISSSTGAFADPIGWTTANASFAGFIGHTGSLALALAFTVTTDSLTPVVTYSQIEIFNGQSSGSAGGPQLLASVTYQLIASGPTPVGDKWARSEHTTAGLAWGLTFDPSSTGTLSPLRGRAWCFVVGL